MRWTPAQGAAWRCASNANSCGGVLARILAVIRTCATRRLSQPGPPARRHHSVASSLALVCASAGRAMSPPAAARLTS